MSFDAVHVFMKYRNGYARERGTLLNPITGETYPKTTWGDVVTFYNLFTKATSEFRTCTAEEVSKFEWSLTSVLATAAGAGPIIQAIDKCTTFMKSDRFRSARSKWEEISPLNRAQSKWGFLAQINLAEAIVNNEEYIDNYFFWKYGEKYAIARSAAGAVKGNIQLLIESTKKSVEDLPSTIKDALESVSPDLSVFVPNVSSWAELVKWGSVGGGLLMLYWYVLRPKNEKR